MSADADDPELREAAKFCAQTVDEYRRWFADNNVPAVASRVCSDDAVFTVMSMSELLTGPIVAALDCLEFSTRTLNQTGHASPHGHPALLRVALTAMTSALWIMDDDDRVRRQRGLIMAYLQAASEADHVLNAEREWLNAPKASDEHAFRQAVDAKKGRIVANGAQLSLTRDEIVKKPKDSAIVRLGGDRLNSTGWFGAGGQSGGYVLSEWRILSGRAHGLQWPLKYAAEAVPNPDRPGFTTIEATWTLDRALGSTRIGIRVLKFLLDRWAELAGVVPLVAQMP